MMEESIWRVSTGFEDLKLPLDYLRDLRTTVENAYASSTVFPPKENMLLALRLLDLEEVKVVILGQDPYPTAGDAMGLAFGVGSGRKSPRSLINIVSELNSDLGCNYDPYKGYDLSGWEKRGVLLLNTILTVGEGRPLSHQQFGWEVFTDAVIKKLNTSSHPIVFILWGRNAQRKISLIDLTKHRIIASPHPSPLSAYHGFFGSRPFSKANRYLAEDGLIPIDWSLE